MEADPGPKKAGRPRAVRTPEKPRWGQAGPERSTPPREPDGARAVRAPEYFRMQFTK